MYAITYLSSRDMRILATLVILLSACRGGEKDSCSSDNDCEESLICHAGVCARPVPQGAECAEQTPCQKALACIDGKCVLLANEGGNCSTGEYCTDGLSCHNGSCFRPLEDGADCANDWICKENLLCVLGQCSARGGADSPCERDLHCQEGLKCLENTCFVPRMTGEKCESVSQCTADLLCFQGECTVPLNEGEKCESGVQCAQGLDCIRKVCFERRGKAGTCEYDDQCIAGLSCFQGICFKKKEEGDRCESNGECKGSFVCRKAQCFRLRDTGERCDEDGECATELWCYKNKCIQHDEKLEGLYAMLKTWNESGTVDCWKASSFDVLSYEACDDIVDAMRVGRTSRSGRTAMKDVLRGRGINKIKGFMIARLGDNLFEAKLLSSEYDWGIGLSTDKRFLLTTVVTDFYTTGVFRIWVERLPAESVSTKSGAYELWPSYRESLIGTAYQIVRDARAGDDTADAAREFMGVILLQTFLKGVVELEARVESGK
jgi:hypothetical protein